MADVYRQSLMSPDTMFIDRPPRGRGGNHYRMVLSERHRILKHYMKKVTSGKKRYTCSIKPIHVYIIMPPGYFMERERK